MVLMALWRRSFTRLGWNDWKGLKVVNTTPSTIIQELTRIQAEAAKGVGALYDAEIKLADAEAKYERTLALTFMETTDGTVKDKEAIAKLKSADDKLAADLARAEYNRIKLKLKQLELAQMSTQTIARMVETELKVLR